MAPTPEDDAAWAALTRVTREQELTALQEPAQARNTSTPSGKSAAQIVAETRARRSKTNG